MCARICHSGLLQCKRTPCSRTPIPNHEKCKTKPRSLVGTTAENQRANPTPLFDIGICHSLLFRIVARRVLPGFGSPQRLLDSHFTSGHNNSQSKGSATIFRRSVPRKMTKAILEFWNAEGATGPLEVEASIFGPR